MGSCHFFDFFSNPSAEDGMFEEELDYEDDDKEGGGRVCEVGNGGKSSSDDGDLYLLVVMRMRLLWRYGV